MQVSEGHQRPILVPQGGSGPAETPPHPCPCSGPEDFWVLQGIYQSHSLSLLSAPSAHPMGFSTRVGLMVGEGLETPMAVCKPLVCSLGLGPVVGDRSL